MNCVCLSSDGGYPLLCGIAYHITAVTCHRDCHLSHRDCHAAAVTPLLSPVTPDCHAAAVAMSLKRIRRRLSQAFRPGEGSLTDLAEHITPEEEADLSKREAVGDSAGWQGGGGGGRRPT